MNKTVKKLDNNVVKALTIACEIAKQEIVGFEWLTHSANYSNFPASLVITCVLDNQQSLDAMLVNQHDERVRKLIQKQLLKAGILLKDVRRHVFFDNEQACISQIGGDWTSRLRKN